MKNKMKFLCTTLAFVLFSSVSPSFAAEEEEDGGGTVVCECAGEGKCKAGGGGAACHTGNKCWKSNANC